MEAVEAEGPSGNRSAPPAEGIVMGRDGDGYGYGYGYGRRRGCR